MNLALIHLLQRLNSVLKRNHTTKHNSTAGDVPRPFESNLSVTVTVAVAVTVTCSTSRTCSIDHHTCPKS